MNYDEAVAWLYSTQGTGIKLGLETIARLLKAQDQARDRAQGDVQGQSQPWDKSTLFHVAGTNGKGSVCAMLDAICRAAGLRTALFTSPHLLTYRERIRIDGEMIPEAAVAAGLTRIRDLVAGWETHPTFFEITTALALDWFQAQQAEVVILETGLGGRLDSTNAVTPAVSILTSISFDHCQYLGNTLESIATEKAGIIKPGVPVLSTPQPPEAAGVIEETARRRNAPFLWIAEPAPHEVALPGSHQKLNAALAIAALRAASLPVSGEAIERGLRQVVWPGRFQRVHRPGGIELILDGAHNEAAASRLVRTWREIHGPENPILLLGVLGDKDVAAICRQLAPLGNEVIVTPVSNARSSTPEALAQIVRQSIPGVHCTIAASPQEALRQAEALALALTPTLTTGGNRRVLITGSLFLIGEILGLLEGRAPGHRSIQ